MINGTIVVNDHLIISKPVRWGLSSRIYTVDETIVSD